MSLTSRTQFNPPVFRRHPSALPHVHEPKARPSLGHRTRNDLAAVAAINSEVVVCRQDHWVRKYFGHADQACVSQAHRYRGVFFHQLRDWLYVLSDLEGNTNSASAEQRANRWTPRLPEEVVHLRENCFASRPRWSELGRLARRPFVMSVATTKKRYKETSINEDVSGHSSWFANKPSCAHSDRSVGHPRSRLSRL